MADQRQRVPMGPSFEEEFSTGIGRGAAQGLQQGLAPYLQQLGVQLPPAGPMGALGQLGQPASFKDMLALQKSQLDKQKLDLARQRLATGVGEKERDLRFKETKDTRKQYVDMAKAASQNLENLARMEQLIDTGKLHGPVLNKLMSKAGLEGWRNPESVEFEKLSTDFLRNAKAIFGSRVTQGEIMRFLQTVPTLMVSDEGKRAVMKNMRRYNEAALIKRRAMDDIISAHGGTPPIDLEAQIEEVAGPQLDELKVGIFEGSPNQDQPQQQAQQRFDQLPDASQFAGRRIRDEKGRILISDGTKWRKE